MGQLTDSARTDGSAILLKPLKPLALFNALLTALGRNSARPTPAAADKQFDSTLGERFPMRILVAEDNLVNQKVAVRLLERDKTVTLTNYANFLAQFPPEWECEIVEDTSWSCAHGVERWRSNCGCSGGKPGFNQEWRSPLRQALDELRDAITPLTEQEGAKLFTDAWAARDGYIDVILDRS